MSRYGIEFVKYLAGLREARTSLTTGEAALLGRLSAGKECVVEVGVFEGATSAGIAGALSGTGRLYLVDPYFLMTRPERILGRAWAMHIAQRETARFRDRVEFVRMTSLEAAARIQLRQPADLIFIDADHSYDAVAADLKAWAWHLAPDGRIAFHDSRLSPLRPDLGPEAGPVRLAAELAGDPSGPWELDATADTLSVFRPKRHWAPRSRG